MCHSHSTRNDFLILPEITFLQKLGFYLEVFKIVSKNCDVPFFQVPVQPSRGVQPNSYESLGRGLHVLHLHIIPRVCSHELSRQVGLLIFIIISLNSLFLVILFLKSLFGIEFL